MNSRNTRLHVVIGMAVLSALSILLMVLIRIQWFVPPCNYLWYDAADISIFIGTFAYGPLSGLIMTVIVSVIQGFVVVGDGIVGVLMHILATGIFAVIAGNIYKNHRTKKGAVVATAIAAVVWVGAMIAWNILITPVYYGISLDVFVCTYLPSTILFNIFKVSINCTVTMLLYKHLTNFIEKRVWHS